MFQLMSYFSLILAFSAVLLESRSIEKNYNDTLPQINPEKPLEASASGAILISSDSVTDLETDSDDQDTTSRLETRDGGGLIYRFFRCFTHESEHKRWKLRQESKPVFKRPVDPVTGMTKSHRHDPNYISWENENRERALRERSFRQKARDCCHEIGPGLHFVGCCCCEHAFDSGSDGPEKKSPERKPSKDQKQGHSQRKASSNKKNGRRGRREFDPLSG